VPLDKGFRLMRSFDLYEVFKRGQGMQSDMMLSRTLDSRAAIAPTN